MNSYETSATVQEQGRVLVAGVPFAPGTEVEISISPKVRSVGEVARPDDQCMAASAAGMPIAEDIFAEMLAYMVPAADVDDSREAIYTRLDGE